MRLISHSYYFSLLYQLWNAIVKFMGVISEKFGKSIWIPFICHLEEIQEDPPTVCVWNATIVPFC
jgi:hypothetical protein